MINENLIHDATASHGGIFKLVVENKNYDWNHQYITGAEIRKLASLPAETALFLAVTEPWNDQPISDVDKVNLGRPDIEHFYYKRLLKLTVNQKHFEWFREYINGKQVKHLANVNEYDQLFLAVERPGEDELITDDAKINLALPGVEHFYSVEVAKEVIIIVNGTPVKWDKNKITFKEVVTIAYGNYAESATMVYTVAYEDGSKQNTEGSMLKNAVVFIKNKMIFHATSTDKS
jgi:hypothetical protein